MAELSLPLAPLPRGTVLEADAREARLRDALPSLRAAVADERDAIALEATLACLLYEALAQASFVGFYRRVRPNELVVGPYQGPLGCLRIALGRGVCGLAAREARVLRVPDVNAFPDHIACDARARSELVVPVLVRGEVRAVLDLDSHAPDAFSDAEGEILRTLLEETFAGSDA